LEADIYVKLAWQLQFPPQAFDLEAGLQAFLNLLKKKITEMDTERKTKINCQSIILH